MRRSLSVLAVLAMLVLAVPSFAQNLLKRPDPVHFTATVQPSPVRAGEYVRVTLNAVIDSPYHLYSIIPPDKESILPTTLQITLGDWKPVGPVTESPAERKPTKFGAEMVEIGTHEKSATFTQVFQVPKTASGNVTPVISARYQACDATSCLPPVTKKPEVALLTIEPGEPRPEFAQPPTPENVTPATAVPSASLPSATPTAPKSESTGLLPFLAAAFGAGLLALLTPCVFPMIPVTLAYFTKQALKPGATEDPNAEAVKPKQATQPDVTGNPNTGVVKLATIYSLKQETQPDVTGNPNAGVVKLATIYSLGIIGAFTGIGAILAATIGAAGATRVAANPWTNLAFAILFIVFGLALLEVFELRLPAGLQNLTGKGRQVGGTLGVLLMGLTFVIAAFTCTAPFVGTVLVAASTASSGAEWLRPILGMATFATALALPFFLLALFPGWLAKMPKSGAWLTTVKGTMGFLELAAAIKFLSNTDLVWNWQVLTRPVMLTLWILIAVLAGLWLFGVLRLGENSPEGRPSVLRGATASAFLAVALYFLVGLTGRPLLGWLNAFLPPAEYGLPTGKGAALPSGQLAFHDTLDKALAAAKAENKPIFIDFTGITCLNCRDMEDNVFPIPEVKQELEKFVRVRLYTDDEKIQKYQEETFRTVALPLYGILNPDGTPVDSIPYTPDAGTFAQFLRQTRERQVADAGR
ncbi:MAG: cytochrome c biogenesis protein CcdA [Capsulimonadales bacterium]|nr:cytochrome c biogenesis protein CcdA [Capsulimonadales bacterium]